MNTTRFIRVTVQLHVLAALTFPLALLTARHPDTAATAFLVSLLAAGTGARSWSVLHADPRAPWASTFRDGGVIALTAMLASWSTLLSGALLGRDGLLNLHSDSVWEHLLVPAGVGLMSALICYLTPLLLAAPLVGLPVSAFLVTRAALGEQRTDGSGLVRATADWNAQVEPTAARKAIRACNTSSGRIPSVDPMLVLGLWASGRPVRFLVISLSALGLDLFILGVQTALTLAEPVRVLIAFLGLSLLAGAPLAGFTLFSPVARARREARSKTHGEEIAVPPGPPFTPTDDEDD